MANLTSEYLDKALTKQSKELKGYVDKNSGTLEKNLKGYVDGNTKEIKGFVSKEIEELALMTARGFAVQGKEIQELIKSVNTLAGIVQELSKTVEDLAAMTARQFAELDKKNNVTERIDKLEREFAQFRHAMQA